MEDARHIGFGKEQISNLLQGKAYTLHQGYVIRDKRWDCDVVTADEGTKIRIENHKGKPTLIAQIGGVIKRAREWANEKIQQAKEAWQLEWNLSNNHNRGFRR